jgi:hypothetical protein
MAQYWMLNKTNLVPNVGVPNVAIPDNMVSTEIPKLKFNFTVQFFPRINIFPELGNLDAEYMMFQLKSATRPSPQVNLEDVNFYNYRSKIATSVKYGSVTISFYDDPLNRAHNLFKKYFELISPITSRTREQTDSLDRQGFSGAASIGSLPDNARNGIFRALAVGQQYQVAGKYKETIYNYLNPKIEQVDLQELDMSMSEPCIVSLTFSYDGVNIIER